MTKSQTILVVDDSAVMRQMISATLTEAGYQVLLADGGEGALAHLRGARVDLVLTDWTMIPMDGGELTRQLRQLQAYAHVPVVVLSTISSDAGKSDARKAGANGWLCKPVRSETLLDVVGSLLRMGQS
jgi:two-component system chemotaxis response regulator CheY